jgi:hypothetical protein
MTHDNDVKTVMIAHMNYRSKLILEHLQVLMGLHHLPLFTGAEITATTSVQRLLLHPKAAMASLRMQGLQILTKSLNKICTAIRCLLSLMKTPISLTFHHHKKISSDVLLTNPATRIPLLDITPTTQDLMPIIALCNLLLKMSLLLQPTVLVLHIMMTEDMIRVHPLLRLI